MLGFYKLITQKHMLRRAKFSKNSCIFVHSVSIAMNYILPAVSLRYFFDGYSDLVAKVSSSINYSISTFPQNYSVTILIIIIFILQAEKINKAAQKWLSPTFDMTESLNPSLAQHRGAAVVQLQDSSLPTRLVLYTTSETSLLLCFLQSSLTNFEKDAFIQTRNMPINQIQ